MKAMLSRLHLFVHRYSERLFSTERSLFSRGVDSRVLGIGV